MSGYERCSKHGLMRCAMCDRPQAVAAIPKTDAAPPAELLDGPTVTEVPVIENKEAEERFWDAVTYPEPAFQVQEKNTRSPNPIVDAAEDYSRAQRAAEIAMRRVETLKLELQQAENAATDAAADRDIKKQVLQKLVSD